MPGLGAKIMSMVFPMYVGVILMLIIISRLWPSIPHVCGGDPVRTPNSRKKGLYSPCMWG